mmetsp:Transcript_1004/g.1002  ORF Transcript_1004/g.1002 Transcript_1004/m.1002 type:complete len:84 (+) Transcript_1004:229-480(+)
MLTISYDDPFNVIYGPLFRAAIGVFLEGHQAKNVEAMIPEAIPQVQCVQLPDSTSLYGFFPYKFSSSLALGATRFLPATFNYL